MLGQHKTTISFHDKVDVSDLISFEVDILKVEQLLWLKKRADPSNEGARLPMQEKQILISALIDVN